ncbi:hypothetical protein M3N64_04515 [Sporolactobacillus sp. CPB3-1]|uniref:Integral membrane protein n=1 Tax=Sporolactobacillus mangiferae TaxID=2940498 RepID=A0ABT0M8L4_9BACL|nr:hypothetical protein [Sporolactobacillus mangiferae]MCL1631211.1 hypothetical protein [Sporolactobacillus mangiferae]
MDLVPWLIITLKTVVLTVSQFVSLLGGIVLGGFVLGFLERQANARIVSVFGMGGIYVTAWLGTPIHELSHAAMCLVFRHRVIEIKLLQAVDAGGTMGYVRHAYNPNSMYQRIGNLFIGVAPIIGGSLAIALCARWLVPNLSADLINFSDTSRLFSIFDLSSWLLLGKSVIAVFQKLLVPANAASLNYWLFLTLSLCIASRMSLSQEDISGARSGATALFAFLLFINVLGTILDPSLRGQMMFWIGRLNFILMVMLSVAIFFSLLVWCLSRVIFAVAAWIRRS